MLQTNTYGNVCEKWGNEKAGEDEESQFFLIRLIHLIPQLLFFITVEVSDARPYKNQGTFGQ
ncbi:hypothetical protein [Calothrix sp. NIES-2098]|uniref:hypothetical protein n=1 Tax=Calothrix sp. NIES-2098 TaxID=1954171 RepID=UPI0030DA4D55